MQILRPHPAYYSEKDVTVLQMATRHQGFLESADDPNIKPGLRKTVLGQRFSKWSAPQNVRRRAYLKHGSLGPTPIFLTEQRWVRPGLPGNDHSQVLSNPFGSSFPGPRCFAYLCSLISTLLKGRRGLGVQIQTCCLEPILSAPATWLSPDASSSQLREPIGSAGSPLPGTLPGNCLKSQGWLHFFSSLRDPSFIA